MPWKKVDPMEERLRFVWDALGSQRSFSELCRQYGISRKTGYKWLARYTGQGVDGLCEASRVPRTCPHQTEQWLVEKVIALRRRWPTWGPRKLAAKLRQQGIAAPACSTIGDILSRAGMVEPRRVSRRSPVRRWPGTLTSAERPNHVWAVDFKGWFRMGDGTPCHPLTVSDLYSRYVIGCKPLPDQRRKGVEETFDIIFRRYGLPEVIRVDNGTPFGSTAPCGLSRLSVGWLKHGITVEYTRPGHPEDNGIHERMHRTLKQEVANPPEKTITRQAKRIEAWRREFNEERPHESIGLIPPSQLYKPSRRRYANSYKEFEYPVWHERRRVRTDGTIRWEGEQRFVGDAFAGSMVGLVGSAEGYDVYLGELFIGVLQANGVSRLVPRGTGRDTSRPN